MRIRTSPARERPYQIVPEKLDRKGRCHRHVNSAIFSPRNFWIMTMVVGWLVEQPECARLS
jgi:hypothetical protein